VVASGVSSAGHGSPRVGDVLEHFSLVGGEAFHRSHQIGNQVGTALQGHIHLRPLGIHGFALRDQIDPTIAAISTMMILVTSVLFGLSQLIGKGEDRSGAGR